MWLTDGLGEQQLRGKQRFGWVLIECGQGTAGQGTVTVKKYTHTVSVVFALSHSLMNPLRTYQNDRQTVPMYLSNLIDLFKFFFDTWFQKNRSKKTQTKNQKKYSDNELLKMLQNHEGDCLFVYFCLLDTVGNRYPPFYCWWHSPVVVSLYLHRLVSNFIRIVFV